VSFSRHVSLDLFPLIKSTPFNLTTIFNLPQQNYQWLWPSRRHVSSDSSSFNSSLVIVRIRTQYHFSWTSFPTLSLIPSVFVKPTIWLNSPFLESLSDLQPESWRTSVAIYSLQINWPLVLLILWKLINTDIGSLELVFRLSDSGESTATLF